jgi:hypothetical protein
MTHPISRYVPLLIEGDATGLLDLFGDAPRINDPYLGWVEGEGFEPFVAASFEGLSERQARVEHVTTTSTALGAVEECILSLVRRGQTVRLPIAIAAGINFGVLTQVRIYHSFWPLVGVHAIRSPILPALAGLVLPGAVERYHERLHAGDVSGVVRQFDTEGSVREPTGEQDLHRGRGELTRYFSGLLALGGVSMERCSLTDDGTSCALEYNLTAWGSVLVPHQAGIAVYERTGAGLLATMRLYDDVARPRPPS